DLLHRHQGSQRDHLADAVADLELLQVLDLPAEIGIRLHVDLPGAAELVEIVYVQRTEVDLQGVEDLAHRNAHGLGRGAVDVEVEPGGIGAEAGERIAQTGRLCALDNDAIGNVLQRLAPEVGSVLDNNLETARGPQPVHGWPFENIDQPVADTVLQA